MRFCYHDFGDLRFEQLVVRICEDLLGIGVNSFSQGPDGGRDGRFAGTASHWPSERQPARGKFIIQSKHTTNPVASYSDREFGGKSDTAILNQEIPKVRKLVQAGQLDHYLLFSNRKLTPATRDQIERRLREDAGVASVGIFGIEDLERLLKKLPAVAKELELTDIENIVRFRPELIVEVLDALALQLKETPRVEAAAIRRSDIEGKNAANGLGESTFKETVGKNVKYFGLVRDFIGDPSNASVARKYEEVVAEYRDKSFQLLEEGFQILHVMNYMFDRLLEVDVDLRRNRVALRMLLHYMYWNCDLGRSGASDVDSD